MRNLLDMLRNKWWLVSWRLPFWRNRRWREHRAWAAGDGEHDETFPLANARRGLTGMVLYVRPDALFYKRDAVFIDGNCEAGARRSLTRGLKVVRDHDGFVVVPRDGHLPEVRRVSDADMPDIFFPVTNADVGPVPRQEEGDDATV